MDTKELQERYSSLVLAKLRKTSVFSGLFNRSYEGTPTAGAVKIAVRDTEVEVGDYDMVQGGELTTPTTEYKTLTIDKNKYVNELIDGYYASAVPDNILADRLDSAGYSMGLDLDKELYELLKTGTTQKTGSINAENVYSTIVDEVQELKHMGLNTSELWLAASNKAVGSLLKSPEFITASETSVINGLVGRIAGVPVIESNNIEDDVSYIIGNKVFCHFVDEWSVPVHVEDLKDGKHIGASAVQGRRVYGDMISRPETVLVHKSSGTGRARANV